MPDESPLDVPPSIEIQIQIDGGGPDIVMAQMVLDFRDYPTTEVKNPYTVHTAS